MTFNPNIPQVTDDLSDSQGQLLINNGALDTSFLVNHYTFSDLTPNNGKHRVIQTPNQGSHPSTAASEPAIYGMQPSANVGVINYSRGPSDAVPTPLTSLQSPVTPITLTNNATTNILDCTGLARGFFLLAAADMATNGSRLLSYVVWTGSTFQTSPAVISTILQTAIDGNILQLKNISSTLSNVYWTLQCLRLS